MQVIDGNRESSVSVADRGLQYGDGCFETMRIHEGKVPLLDRHIARLERSIDTLAFPMNDAQPIAAAIAAHVASYPADDWLKVVLTRGSGARGYRVTGNETPVIILTSGTHSPRMENARMTLALSAGIAADNGQLPPLKTLGRLAEVMRTTMHPSTDEQLVCDRSGALVCGNMSNVFLVIEGVTRTPRLEHSGIAGVMREWVIEHHPVQVQRLTVEDALLADEVFLTNALRGIMPVGEVCGTRKGEHSPMTQRVQQSLRDSGFPQ
ncbi:MAG: aminodeoxychorismate lyase [Pseudomonadota bacterium]